MSIAPSLSSSTHGLQIADVRIDELDRAALTYAATFSRPPSVLDLGCGVGTMSVELGKTGAIVAALDKEDNDLALVARRAAAGLSPSTVRFFNGAAPECLGDSHAYGRPWDIVYSQRMLHYLTVAKARETLVKLRAQCNKNCGLFLSVSGLLSELANGYEHTTTPIADRFCELASEQQSRHGILEPVCLYSLDEFKALVQDSGFVVTRSWLSPFGNVKLQAMVGV